MRNITNPKNPKPAKSGLLQVMPKTLVVKVSCIRATTKDTETDVVREMQGILRGKASRASP
jgi:hypothetical protein